MHGAPADGGPSGVLPQASGWVYVVGVAMRQPWMECRPGAARSSVRATTASRAAGRAAHEVRAHRATLFLCLLLAPAAAGCQTRYSVSHDAPEHACWMALQFRTAPSPGSLPAHGSQPAHKGAAPQPCPRARAWLYRLPFHATGTGSSPATITCPCTTARPWQYPTPPHRSPQVRPPLACHTAAPLPTFGLPRHCRRPPTKMPSLSHSASASSMLCVVSTTALSHRAFLITSHSRRLRCRGRGPGG
jgi:hypothetical protein